MNKKIYLLILLTTWLTSTWAQNDMKGMQMPQADTTKSMDDGMQGMDMSGDKGAKGHKQMDMSSMCSALSLNLPMQRDGSGTSWLPDASPMYAYMKHVGPWMFMFHGNIFVRYDRQDIFNAGTRGGDRWDAPDMLMAMGQRKVGAHGLFHVNVMLSTDALITGGSGYPLLFQTGESWHGQPLVDRQHPHDLFSELSVSYAYALSQKADVSVYVGYPGEPALGPVTFMHRPSGEFMPDAPISHHWADATHITFGVATVGIRYGIFKLEGSSFTGREPDENRYDFDKPLFDSWSGRLSCNPTDNWALQVSHGFVKSPEALHPDEDVHRTTASATYSLPFADKKYIAATALWGQNATPGVPASNAALLEATLKVNKLAVYARYEWVQKSAEELNLAATYTDRNKMYPLQEVTAGAGYDLFSVAHINVAAGAQLTLYHADAALQPLYGSTPIGGEVYLHFYPKMMH